MFQQRNTLCGETCRAPVPIYHQGYQNCQSTHTYSVPLLTLRGKKWYLLPNVKNFNHKAVLKCCLDGHSARTSPTNYPLTCYNPLTHTSFQASLKYNTTKLFTLTYNEQANTNSSWIIYRTLLLLDHVHPMPFLSRGSRKDKEGVYSFEFSVM